MPENLADVSTGTTDLYFGSSLQGTEFRLIEAIVYDAAEVRAETGDDMPEFGRWLPATVDGRDVWLSAVGELLDELKRYDSPETVVFKVTRCQKSGSGETDPYEVNLEPVDETGQERL